MKVHIIVIGDELLLGHVSDSNSGFIARTIAPASWSVSAVETVGDNPDAMLDAIARGFKHADVVITTGGLGPTRDDITKGVLCRYFACGLHEDSAVKANVIDVMARRGREINDLTLAQATVPDACKVIPNRVGTAPALWFERDGKVLVAMPGVPFETEHIFTTEVFPRLFKKYHSGEILRHHSMIITDISESALAEKINDIETALPFHLHLAYLPNPGYIHLRIDAHGDDPSSLDKDIARLVENLTLRLGHLVASHDNIAPAAMLLNAAVSRGLTIATAESCTGGNIAHELTLIPGSSAAMAGGIVAYSNNVKMKLLGVKETTLTAHGAVSIPVVEQMAQGVTRATGAHIGIATSGIAGPGGGTPAKPVGTVCIAVTAPSGTKSGTYHFTGNRSRIINHATSIALLLAHSLIHTIPPIKQKSQRHKNHKKAKHF